MSDKCVVPFCTSIRRKNKDVSFHEFPSDLTLRNKWAQNISRKNVSNNELWSPQNDRDYVCSIHFNPSDYIEGKRKMLKKGSVPTIFPHYPSYLQKSSNSIKRNPPKERQPVIATKRPDITFTLNQSQSQTVVKQENIHENVPELNPSKIFIDSAIQVDSIRGTKMDPKLRRSYNLKINRQKKMIEKLRSRLICKKEDEKLYKEVAKIKLIAEKGDIEAQVLIEQINSFSKLKFQEICSSTEQNVDKIYSISSDTDTGSLSDVQMLSPEIPEYKTENIEAIRDHDHDHIESIVDKVEDLIRPNPVHTLKNLQIILEPLPIQYSFSDGESFNVKEEAIANFIQRDRSIIKMRKPKEIMNAKSRTCSELIKSRKIKKLTLNESNQKPKLVRTKIIRGLIKHCSICNINFNGNKRYMAHHRRVHTGERPFQCHKCPKNFFSDWHLTEHLKTHGIGHGVLQCSICSKFWTSKSKLDRHMNHVHLGIYDGNSVNLKRGGIGDSVRLKLWLCDSCPRSFGLKKSLEEHVLTKHLGHTFKCPQTDCERTFNSNFGLSNHIKKIHEKAFKFFCHVENCGKGYLVESDLKRHNEYSHLKVKKFICDKCPDKKYYFKSDFNKHYLVNHTGEKKVKKRITESEKKYKCKYCSKAFASSRNMKRHLKLHTGIRDQICEYCGEAYSLKMSLDSHIAYRHFGFSKILANGKIPKRKNFGRKRRFNVPIIPDIPIEEMNVLCNIPNS